MKHFHEVLGLCTKSPVRNLTRRSIRTFWPHYEGFFATKEVCFYSKKSYKGTTFGAKPSTSRKCTSVLADVKDRKSQSALLPTVTRVVPRSAPMTNLIS